MIRASLLLLLFSMIGTAAELVPATDLPAAIGRAKAEGKLVFVEFTGSDWCVPCIKFEQNVMTHAVFAEFIAGRLVPVRLDIPYRKKLEAGLKQRNEALATKFGIKIYPTFLILDATGEEVGRRESYLGETAEEFVKSLRRLLRDARKK